MVLHLGGCGRVGHRHNTPYKRVGPGTRSFQAPPAFVIRGPTRIHDHAQPTSEHTPKPNHTLSVSDGSIKARNGANARIVFACVSAFVFSYEALDPVLCRVLSDELVLAAPLPQMALECFIRVIRYSGREPWIVINHPLRYSPCFCLSVSISSFGPWILCFFAT